MSDIDICEVTTIAKFTMDELVELLIEQLSEEELIELIQNIDNEVAELDFTKKLKDHFDEMYHTEQAVIAEENAFEKYDKAFNF